MAKKSTLLTLAALGMLSFGLSACETVKGAGNDIESAGRGIENASEAVQNSVR